MLLKFKEKIWKLNLREPAISREMYSFRWFDWWEAEITDEGWRKKKLLW